MKLLNIEAVRKIYTLITKWPPTKLRVLTCGCMNDEYRLQFITIMTTRFAPMIANVNVIIKNACITSEAPVCEKYDDPAYRGCEQLIFRTEGAIRIVAFRSITFLWKWRCSEKCQMVVISCNRFSNNYNEITRIKMNGQKFSIEFIYFTKPQPIIVQNEKKINRNSEIIVNKFVILSVNNNLILKLWLRSILVRGWICFLVEWIIWTGNMLFTGKEMSDVLSNFIAEISIHATYAGIEKFLSFFYWDPC